MRRRLLTGLLLAGAGCSGGTDVAQPGTNSLPAVPGVVCAAAAAPVAAPAGFPDVVPLPDGTLITSAEERSEGRLVIDAVAPEDFATTLTFFQDSFPAAGLALEAGEVEEHDAESDFVGAGYRGRWKVTDLVECGDTRIELVVAPA